MDTALLSLALTAGAVAALNPCGFALLPAYLGLMLREDGPQGAAAATQGSAGPGGGVARSVRRAIGLTAVMTLGFVLVFAAFGLIVAPLSSSVQQYLPWVTLATGLALAVVGALMVAGRQVKVPGLRLGGRALDGGFVSTFGYGVTYALASLTCTIGPFLAVVVTSLRSSEVAEGLVLFVAYAGGMGLVVGTAAVAVALARTGLVGTLRSSGRWLPRVAGLLIAVVGAYVAYYGVWELRVLDGADPADPIIDTALSWQAALSGFVSDLVSID